MWDAIVLSSAMMYALSETHRRSLTKVAIGRMYMTFILLVLLIGSILFLTSRQICDIEQMLIVIWALLLVFEAWFFTNISMPTYKVSCEFIIFGLVLFTFNAGSAIIAIMSPSYGDHCVTGRIITTIYVFGAFLLMPCITSIIVVIIKSNAPLTQTEHSRRRTSATQASLPQGMTVGGIRQSIPNQEECAICLLPLEDEIITMMCAHSFHTQCVNTWLQQQGKRTCPLCRSDV